MRDDDIQPLARLQASGFEDCFFGRPQASKMCGLSVTLFVRMKGAVQKPIPAMFQLAGKGCDVDEINTNHVAGALKSIYYLSMTHAGKQTIFITGAATGIGHQAALELARRGHRVIATAQHLADLTALRQAAEAAQLALTYDELDITSTEQAQVMARKYQIDVLINNAAIGDSGPIVEVPLERVRTNFDVNVTGTLNVIQAFVPQFIKRRQGRIVVMGSMVGLVTPLFFNPYSATKAAIESICASMRMELRYFNIAVVTVNPGRIDGGHNAAIEATKYDWLKQSSPYYPLLGEMQRHDDMMLQHAYPIASILPAIVQAVEAKHPRLRYATPFKYRLGLFFIRLLPSRTIDWIFMKATRLKLFK